MSDPIPFNRPAISGRELAYIEEAIALGQLSAGGAFTLRCESLLQERGGISRVLMTASGTAALEMAALLCDLGPGDEVIMPSFTFVSTASAFVRCGATPVFVDIRDDTLNLDERLVARAITPRTRAIVAVHYGGVACEMECLAQLAAESRIRLIEDAAHGIDATYRGRELGSLGDLGIYSFHETKNVVCGEGGALCVNDESLVERAEILRDKGTDRQRFLRGEVDRYTWVDLGSSFGAGELACAFLCAQLESAARLTEARRARAGEYRALLAPLEAEGCLRLPATPADARDNAHAFFVRTRSGVERDALRAWLGAVGISSVSHYVPLHSSRMGEKVGRTHGELPVTDAAAERLLRLPMFPGMTPEQVARTAGEIRRFYSRSGRPGTDG